MEKVSIPKAKNTQHIFDKTLSNKSEKGSKLHWMSLNVFSSNYKVSCMMKVYPLVKREQNWRISKLKYYYMNLLTDVVYTVESRFKKDFGSDKNLS